MPHHTTPASDTEQPTSDPLTVHVIPLKDIHTDEMRRERTCLAEDKRQSWLRRAIRAEGQQTPVTLFRDAYGTLQLNTGWRRYQAMSDLYRSTQAPKFASLRAFIFDETDRLTSYVLRADENAQRGALSFGEMARLAIIAAEDPKVTGLDAHDIVAVLFKNIGAQKRSYIRHFVYLLQVLEEDLLWINAVPRDLGVAVSRGLRSYEEAAQLRAELRSCTTSAAQTEVLKHFARREGAHVPPSFRAREVQAGGIRVIARKGMCQLIAPRDFAEIPDWQLDRAARAFEVALATSARVRPL